MSKNKWFLRGYFAAMDLKDFLSKIAFALILATLFLGPFGSAVGPVFKHICIGVAIWLVVTSKLKGHVLLATRLVCVYLLAALQHFGPEHVVKEIVPLFAYLSVGLDVIWMMGDEEDARGRIMTFIGWVILGSTLILAYRHMRMSVM